MLCFIADAAAGTWIATNPKRHRGLRIGKNAECNGKFVPFVVKMIKGINRELGEPVSPSFPATAPKRIDEKWDDPAGRGGDVTAVVSPNRKLACVPRMIKGGLGADVEHPISQDSPTYSDDGQRVRPASATLRTTRVRQPNP
jgi:hypothetical protein